MKRGWQAGTSQIMQTIFHWGRLVAMLLAFRTVLPPGSSPVATGEFLVIWEGEICPRLPTGDDDTERRRRHNAVHRLESGIAPCHHAGDTANRCRLEDPV